MTYNLSGMVEKAVALLKAPSDKTREAAAGLLHNTCVLVTAASDRTIHTPSIFTTVFPNGFIRCEGIRGSAVAGDAACR